MSDAAEARLGRLQKQENEQQQQKVSSSECDPEGPQCQQPVPTWHDEDAKDQHGRREFSINAMEKAELEERWLKLQAHDILSSLTPQEQWQQRRFAFFPCFVRDRTVLSVNPAATTVMKQNVSDDFITAVELQRKLINPRDAAFAPTMRTPINGGVRMYTVDQPSFARRTDKQRIQDKKNRRAAIAAFTKHIRPQAIANLRSIHGTHITDDTEWSQLYTGRGWKMLDALPPLEIPDCDELVVQNQAIHMDSDRNANSMLIGANHAATALRRDEGARARRRDLAG